MKRTIKLVYHYNNKEVDVTSVNKNKLKSVNNYFVYINNAFKTKKLWGLKYGT